MRFAGDGLDAERRRRRASCGRGACRASTAISCSAGQPWGSPDVGAAIRVRCRLARSAARLLSWCCFQPGQRPERRRAAGRPRPPPARPLPAAGHSRLGHRGANGSVNSNSSSTSATASSGAAARSTSCSWSSSSSRASSLSSRASSSSVDCSTGHAKGPQAPLARQGHRAGQRDFQRRPSAGIGAARDPVVDVGVAAFLREQVGHARQRGGVDRPAITACRAATPSHRSGLPVSLDDAMPFPVIRSSRAAARRSRSTRRSGPEHRCAGRTTRRSKTLDNTATASACQKMSTKTTRNLPAPRRPGARRPLVLASTSRYRRALLDQLGLPFAVASPATDETPLPGEAPAATALRLAEAKARSVARDHPGALVIGSDQVADCDGRAVGKPVDHADAVAQLTALSGRTVVFHTGLALLDAASGDCQTAMVDVRSTFRDLAPARDRGVSAPRPALRLRGVGQVRCARHRAVRAHRKRRPDGAHRPAADPADRHAARRRRGDPGAAGVTRRDDRAAPPRERDMPGRLYLVPNLLGVVAARRRAARAHDRDRPRARAFRRREREAGARVPEDARHGRAAAADRHRRDRRAAVAAALRRTAGAGARRARSRHAVGRRLPGRGRPRRAAGRRRAPRRHRRRAAGRTLGRSCSR